MRATVDGTPPGETPSSTTRSAESPTSASACGASVAARRPERFALVTRSAPPHAAIRRRVQAWSGTRTPSPCATTVSAPGQWRRPASAAAAPTKRAAASASAARSAIGFCSARPLIV